jgi:t-SNARE complex subunit (syntaxin)
MSQKALLAYILLILTDSHLGVLEQHADMTANATIVTELLKASKKLEVRYLDEIEQRLITLANGDPAMLQAIDAKMEERIRQARKEKLLPYFILLITLLLCVLMYLYGS